MEFSSILFEMALVKLTANLQKYFPKREIEVEAGNLRELLRKMDEIEPRFSHYIVDDQSHVRRHVNIFIDGRLLEDKTRLDTAIDGRATVHIMQALSGG